MEWRNRNCITVFDAVDQKTGGKADDFLHPYQGPYEIQNGEVMAAWLKAYAAKNVPITIVGDFDCDGICATAELFLALKSFGAGNVKMRIPRRMSEGYGISPDIVEEINSGIVVTVDNGISALEAVEACKRKGLIVLVIDHHLPVKTKEKGIQLPCADLIVDPMVEDAYVKKGKLVNTTFRQYCGAGLVYKICQYMKCPPNIMDQVVALAAIATVADVMPLIEDNRNIFNHGINSMYRGNVTPGTEALVGILQSGNIVTASDIGFKLAPMLNAPGRLYDRGAEKSLKTLLSSNYAEAADLVEELQQINEKRKRLKEEAVERAEKIIEDNCLYGRNPLVIVDSITEEGLVGLVAGTLQEEYHVSCFVFTEKDGYLKGSARGIDEDHLKEGLDLLNEKCPGILLRYGGHKSAAGVSIEADMLQSFADEMAGILSPYQAPDDALVYDLEIKSGEIKKKCAEIQKFAPFGEGNPDLVFCIRDFKLIPQNNAFYSLFKNGTIKFEGAGCTAIAFSMFEKYRLEGYPAEMDLVGKLSYRSYMGKMTPQVEILDLKAVTRKRQPALLLDTISDTLKKSKLA